MCFETVCKYIDVDRGQIFIFKDEYLFDDEIYEWMKIEIGSIKAELFKVEKDKIRWAFKRLSTGNSIILSNIGQPAKNRGV